MFFAPGVPVASAAWKPILPGKYLGFQESYRSEIAAYELDKSSRLSRPWTGKRSRGGPCLRTRARVDPAVAASSARRGLGAATCRRADAGRRRRAASRQPRSVGYFPLRTSMRAAVIRDLSVPNVPRQITRRPFCTSSTFALALR